jgi:hypothetical protein
MESRLPGTIPRGKGDATMKFMIIVKASKNSKAEVMPSEELLTALGKYNGELAKAGAMLAAEGLHPTSKGARERFARNKRRKAVISGPPVLSGEFCPTKEKETQCKSNPI